MTEELYPLALSASLHVKVWGGRRLETTLGKALPTDEPYGEAWELHDTSLVTNGPLAGQSLGAVLARWGQDLVGDFDPSAGFPLLAKFIDASDWLSVQVHPNDEQARELEGDPRGKTEAWLILSAEAGARLVKGIRPGTPREVMAEAIRTGTLEEMLVYAEVEAGDVFFIPANTVHAIGPGILLYEIQQSSDITYRLYDWNRMGLDGKPRPMHIDKGVAVSNIDSVPTITHPAGESAIMVTSPYFETRRLTLGHHNISYDTAGRFQALTCIEGQARIQANDVTVDLARGQTALVPAGLPQFVAVGPAMLLQSYPVLR